MSSNLSPAEHLAAILTAYHESDGLHISYELKEMLDLAEADFDGVEVEDMEFFASAHQLDYAL